MRLRRRGALLALVALAALVRPPARAQDAPPRPAGEAEVAALISTLVGASPSAAAIDARRRLLEAADPATVLRLVRARGAGAQEPQMRWAMVGCDLLAELLEQRRANGPLPADLPRQMVELLDLEVHGGGGELALAFAALPRGDAVAALTSRIAAPAGPGRARAARILGEMVPGQPDVVPQLVELLGDAQPEVRLAALLSLDLHDRSPDPPGPGSPLARLAELAGDVDARVAGEALRIAAERSLLEVRPTAEVLARRDTAPVDLRVRAIATLGALRQEASITTLRMLVTVERPPEISRTACWALSVVGDASSRPVIQRRLQRAGALQEQPLYTGLARGGALEDLCAMLQPDEGDLSKGSAVRANRAIRALGRAGFAPDPKAIELAVAALVGVARGEEPAPEDLQAVVRALTELDLLTPGRAPIARTAAAELLLERPELAFEIQLMNALTAMGPPDDLELKERLWQRLVDRLDAPSTSRAYTEAVTSALVAVDPARAQASLRAYFKEITSGSSAPGLARIIVRGLARAGDPSLVFEHAVRTSRDELIAARSPSAQLEALFRVGQDLMEANRWDEAALEMRRVRRAVPHHWIPLFCLGAIHIQAGRTELGWRYLQRALARHPVDPVELVTNPWLAPVRDDPRYRRALARAVLQSETGTPLPHDVWFPPSQPQATGAGGG